MSNSLQKAFANYLKGRRTPIKKVHHSDKIDTNQLPGETRSQQIARINGEFSRRGEQSLAKMRHEGKNRTSLAERKAWEREMSKD